MPGSNVCLIDAGGAIYCMGDGLIFPNRQVYSGPDNDCVPPFTGPGGVFSDCYAVTPLRVDVPEDDYVGLSNTCALTSSGDLRCWPYTMPGCSGDPSCRTSAVASAGLRLKSASVFGDGWCGVTTDGAGYCSFIDRSGVSAEFQWLPPIAIPGDRVFTKISAHANKYAALDPDGHAWIGALGTGSGGALEPFAPGPFEPDQTFTDIQVSNTDNHVTSTYYDVNVCGLTSAGGVICTGVNNEGQRGNGTLTPLNTPLPPPTMVQGLPPVVELSVGFFHSCARTDAGDLYCWGRSTEGELGYMSTVECEPENGIFNYCSATPMKADLSVRRVSAGANSTCVETMAGELRCLGLPWASSR
jgi:hypothetical protein